MNEIIKSTLHTYKYLLDVAQGNASAKTMLAAIMVLPDVSEEISEMKSALIKQLAESPDALKHMKEAGAVERLLTSGYRWELGAYLGSFAKHIVRNRSISIFQGHGSKELIENLKLAHYRCGEDHFTRTTLVALGLRQLPIGSAGEEVVNMFNLNLGELEIEKQREAVVRYFKDKKKFSASLINKIYDVGLHTDNELWEQLSVAMGYAISRQHMYSSIRALSGKRVVEFKDNVLKDYLMKFGKREFDLLKNGLPREQVERLTSLYKEIELVEKVRNAFLRGNLMCLTKFHNNPVALDMMRERFTSTRFNVEMTTVSNAGEISSAEHSSLTLDALERKFGPLEVILQNADQRETGPGTQFISRLSASYRSEKRQSGIFPILTNDIVHITEDEIKNRLRYEYGGERKPRKRDNEVSALSPI